jgi:hypothetical protein
MPTRESVLEELLTLEKVLKSKRASGLPLLSVPSSPGMPATRTSCRALNPPLGLPLGLSTLTKMPSLVLCLSIVSGRWP